MKRRWQPMSKQTLKLTFLGCLVEESWVWVVDTDQRAAGNEVMVDGELRDVSEQQRYTEVLPSLSLVLSPTTNCKSGWELQKIMRRPSFGDLSPTVRFPLNTGQAVVVGDPTLQPTTASQFDLAVEYYPRKGSVFSLGVYYKDLDSVIGKQTVFSGIATLEQSMPTQVTRSCASTCTVGVRMAYSLTEFHQSIYQEGN